MIIGGKCLSGGAIVYAKTQKGEMPMMVRDMARLDPATVQLWSGDNWIRLVAVSKTKRTAVETEIVLRSGERISCTPTHRFPTDRGPLEAAQIRRGDRLRRMCLPEPATPMDSAFVGEDAAWLAGLYIAEGSRSEDTIQIAGHAKEEGRWLRLREVAKAYGGSATRTIDGNVMGVRLYGKVTNALIDQFVSGKTAKTKCLSPVCWRYSNGFLEAILAGYLEGDGHWEPANNRWRLGFTRNYNLERDLRGLCARLGYHLVLKLATVAYDGRRVGTFRGEIRMGRSGHWNERNTAEVVQLRKARCREVYDIAVETEPYLFALASGLLTHSSNPMSAPPGGQHCINVR